MLCRPGTEHACGSPWVCIIIIIIILPIQAIACETFMLTCSILPRHSSILHSAWSPMMTHHDMLATCHHCQFGTQGTCLGQPAQRCTHSARACCAACSSCLSSCLDWHGWTAAVLKPCTVC
ncbi:hypothetical protein COO60DRAFT_661661 [Scenedesmus sp. NREL 46B-D3]|nr:hypothetical protein COO60DRAFT_661661 [Scenedesmus sp. NREL 46B-D3]